MFLDYGAGPIGEVTGRAAATADSPAASMQWAWPNPPALCPFASRS